MIKWNELSLAEKPEFRGIGAFGGDEPSLKWVQPRDLWQLQLMLHEGEMVVDGVSIMYKEFDVFVLTPGARCETHRFGRESFVYDFISFCPVESDRDVVTLPLHISLGEELGHQIDLEFRKTLNRLAFSRTSSHIFAWNLLWMISTPEHVMVKSIYTEEAEKIIESQIGEKLSVKYLCEELSISQSQLARYFLADHGKSPIQYIRDRKAHHAYRLLTTTTTPIKQVALLCGIGNVHQFNRFIRERFGSSPRDVRKNRGQVDVFRVGSIKKGRSQE